MRDIALHIDTYSEPTSLQALEQAVGFAQLLDAALTGIAIRIDIQAPANWLAERLLNVSQLAKAEERTSWEACLTSLKL